MESRHSKALYEPPKATFVPVKVDERLMTCCRSDFCSFGPAGSYTG